MADPTPLPVHRCGECPFRLGWKCFAPGDDPAAGRDVGLALAGLVPADDGADRGGEMTADLMELPPLPFCALHPSVRPQRLPGVHPSPLPCPRCAVTRYMRFAVEPDLPDLSQYAGAYGPPPEFRTVLLMACGDVWRPA